MCLELQINYFVFYATLRIIHFPTPITCALSFSQPRWPGCNQKSTFSHFHRGKVFSCFLLFIWIFIRRAAAVCDFSRRTSEASLTFACSNIIALCAHTSRLSRWNNAASWQRYLIFLSLISAHHHDHHQGAPVKYLKQLPSDLSSYGEKSLHQHFSAFPSSLTQIRITLWHSSCLYIVQTPRHWWLWLLTYQLDWWLKSQPPNAVFDDENCSVIQHCGFSSIATESKVCSKF